MAAKTRPSPPSESGGWLRRSTQLLLLVVLVAALLGAVILAGHWGLEQLRGRDRYLVSFADIECEPPAGMAKADFLDEVLFASRLPKVLDLLDDDLTEKLQVGFAKHPWVEKVESVEIKPPRQIVVNLVHRTAVLAVKVGDKTFAVDGYGILLRPNAPVRGLPIYDGAAKAPTVPAGTRWGDPDIEAAARKLRK